jgi:hypothetical protein
VTARAGLPMDESFDVVPRPVPVKEKEGPPSRSAYLWALLLARIYEVFPLLWAHWGEPIEVHCVCHRGALNQAYPGIHRGADNPHSPIAPTRGSP